MKAIEQRGYGDPRTVLHLTDVPVPEVTADGVLVRVHAASANPYDWHLICGEPLLMRASLGGLRGPRRVAGADFAGVVEAVGTSVHGIGVGDEVHGCADGAFAEYVVAPAGRLAPKPTNLSFARAAAVPMAAVTAWQGLRRGGLAAGRRVLVIGASGGVGTFAVQLAKDAGAEVTGVCSTGPVELVRGLGASDVVDYTTTDPTAGPPSYDLVLQLGGSYSPRAVRRRLTPEGTLVQSYGDGNRWVGPIGGIVSGVVLNWLGSRRIVSFVAKDFGAALRELRDPIEAGRITPVIHSELPLERAADAVALVREGRPAGKVVVTVA